MAYINGKLYWKTRTPTRHGYALPLPKRTRSVCADEPSSAQRRRDQRMSERIRDDRYVQLTPGTLVVFQRQPYRIVEIREVPTDLWDEKYEEGFGHACAHWDRYPYGERPERGTWRDRPVNIVLRPDGHPETKPLHLTAPGSYDWDVLPEHYAICNACGELPPCQHEIDEDSIRSTVHRTEELMAIQPGCCLGCTEPITSRMKAVRFPGPNLWRPDLGDGSAVFHARQQCAGDVARYRKQWEEKGHGELQPELPTGAAGDDA